MRMKQWLSATTPKVILASVFVTLLAVTPSGAFADDHYKGHKEHDQVMQDFLKEINATPDQKKQFEEHHKQYEAQVEPIRQSIFEKKAELIEYLAAPNSTKEEALQKESEIQDLKAQMGRAYIDHVYTKRSFLTPDQQQKASAFFQKQVDDWKKNHSEKDMDN